MSRKPRQRAHAPAVTVTTTSAGAFRQRKRTQRKLRGLTVLHVPIDVQKLKEAMLDADRISIADADDLDKVAADAADLLRQWIEWRRWG